MQALSMLGSAPNGIGSSGLSPWHHIGDVKDSTSLVHQSVGLGPPPSTGMVHSSSVGCGGVVHGSSVRGLHQGPIAIHPDCSGTGGGGGGSQMSAITGSGSVNNNNNGGAGGQHQHHHHHHHQNSGERGIQDMSFVCG